MLVRKIPDLINCFETPTVNLYIELSVVTGIFSTGNGYFLFFLNRTGIAAKTVTYNDLT